MLYGVTYRSRSLIPATGPELITLARCCMINNARLGVTGGLFYDDDAFFQTIEGDENAVAVLFDRIRVDPRHDRVEVLARGPIPRRHFAGWSMKFVHGAWLGASAAARRTAPAPAGGHAQEVEARVAALAAA